MAQRTVQLPSTRCVWQLVLLRLLRNVLKDVFRDVFRDVFTGDGHLQADNSVLFSTRETVEEDENAPKGHGTHVPFCS